jgi:predicted RNA methylase
VNPDQQGFIYELGADWGALAFPLAKHCPGATVVADELSPVPWIFLKLRALLSGPRNLKIVRCNFIKEDLSKAFLVVCCLYPGAMTVLSSKLVKELEPSTMVISNTFAVPAWTLFFIQSLEEVMCGRYFIIR